MAPGKAWAHHHSVDLTATNVAITVVCALSLVVAVVGVVIPGVPALLVGWSGVLLWTVFSDSGSGKWWTLAVVTAVAALGFLGKYALPGRRLKRVGVPNLSLVAGAVVGLIGFFVVPVVGVLLGFVVGTWLAETVRLRSVRRAWPSTWLALKATGLAMVIELGACLAMTVAWFVGAALV